MGHPSTRRLATALAALGLLTLSITACSTQSAAPASTAKPAAPAASAPTTAAASAAAPAPTAAQQAQPAGQPIKLRISVPNPDGNIDALMAQFLSKRAKELSNGQIDLQVFTNGVLGSDTAGLEQVQTGTLDMCSVTAYSNMVKLGTVFELPYLFRDYDHWQKAMDGKPGQAVVDAALPLGLRILGFQAGGWRQTYGNKDIKTMADFKGFKLRVMPVTAYTELFKDIEAQPTPMSWQEVYLALQQKTIDGAETALPSMFTSKHYEVSKYVTLTDHAMSTVAIVFSEQKWKTLPANVQQILTQAGKEAAAYEREEWKKQDAQVVKDLKEKGMTVNTIDKAPLQQIAQTKVFPALVTDPAQKALLDQVLAIK